MVLRLPRYTTRTSCKKLHYWYILYFQFYEFHISTFKNILAFSPTNNDDTTPLVPPFIGTDLSRQPTDVDFYSPYDSVHNSDDEDAEVNLNFILCFIYFNLKFKFLQT